MHSSVQNDKYSDTIERLSVVPSGPGKEVGSC